MLKCLLIWPSLSAENVVGGVRVDVNDRVRVRERRRADCESRKKGRICTYAEDFKESRSCSLLPAKYFDARMTPM